MPEGMLAKLKDVYQALAKEEEQPADATKAEEPPPIAHKPDEGAET
jgi:hypothetical protein